MNRLLVARRMFLILISLALTATATAGGALKCSDPAYEGTFACRQVILRHESSFNAEAFAARFGLRLLGTVRPLATTWFEAPEGTETRPLLESIKRYRESARTTGILHEEINPVFLTPECQQLNISIIDLDSGERHFKNQPALAAMGADPTPSYGLGVTVAVLDTGVSRSHPALGGALISPGIDPLAGGGLADDLSGHGTAVAGVIHLVAPGAWILPVKVLDEECNGTAFELAAGIVGAVEAGADVINMSLGTREKSRVVEAAVSYAAKRGVLIVAAAGNSSARDKNSGHVRFPASHKEVLAVTAVDADLVAPPWVVADDHVALCAPGVDVVAPYGSGYALLQGSSFSSAWVSGAAAIALAADPKLNRTQLRHRLLKAVRPVERGNPKLYHKLGEGVPDVSRLARAAD